MNRTASLHLDLMRLIAALTIFLSHANYGRFTGGLPGVSGLKFLGDDAVIVFFVLSGFVISYVAEHKETTLKEYTVSRFARLYSVVIPAIVVTIILDNVGAYINPELYNGWWCQWDHPIWRATANLLFINELWLSSVRPFSNGPFWSLGFEFWYYVAFGAAYYLNGLTRYFAVGAALLIAGPKIMLSLPIWLLGVLTWRITQSRRMSEETGWLLCLGSIAGYVLFIKNKMPDVLSAWSMANLNDLFFWTDIPFIRNYAIGIFVMLHLIGFSAVAHRFANPLDAISRHIRHFAGFTFAIYLFHYPLLQFISALTTGIPSSALRNSIIVLGTLGAIYALGLFTESKKLECKNIILSIDKAILKF